MRLREYKTYLAIAGMPEETLREQAPEIVRECWETTARNEASMQTLVMILVTKTEKRLWPLNFVTYYPSCIIRDIQTMEFGINLDTTYQRSHMGLSIASVWNMKCTVEDAAIMENEDDKFAGAIQTSTDDVGKSQGKPGQSPNSITELLAAIKCCIIHLEAFISEKDHHQEMACQLRAVLREKNHE